MKLTSYCSEESYIITLNGDLDASSSVVVDAELEKAIKECLPNLLVDCQDLNYISSTGLGVFISYLHTLQNKKIKLVLFGMSEKIKNIFAILGLQKLVNVTDTLEEALSLCQGIPSEKL